MRQLWEELHLEVPRAGDLCQRCGRCCDFPRSGHRLFSEGIEARYALAVADHVAAEALGAGLCPFYAKGICANRGGRPLGCRTYFCHETGHGARQETHEVFLRRLRGLAAAWGFPVNYRPFLDHLTVFLA
jgi:Fe-S-cluster containining protein